MRRLKQVRLLSEVPPREVRRALEEGLSARRAHARFPKARLANAAGRRFFGKRCECWF